jgi:hypothetical protein
MTIKRLVGESNLGTSVRGLIDRGSFYIRRKRRPFHSVRLCYLGKIGVHEFGRGGGVSELPDYLQNRLAVSFPVEGGRLYGLHGR